MSYFIAKVSPMWHASTVILDDPEAVDTNFALLIN